MLLENISSHTPSILSVGYPRCEEVNGVTLRYKILSLWCIMNMMMAFRVVGLEDRAGRYGSGTSGSSCCLCISGAGKYMGVR